MSQAEEKAKEFVKSLEGLSAIFMYQKIEDKVKELYFEIDNLEENLFNKEACQVTDNDMQVFNDDNEFSEFGGYCVECLEYYPACECENEK